MNNNCSNVFKALNPLTINIPKNMLELAGVDTTNTDTVKKGLIARVSIQDPLFAHLTNKEVTIDHKVDVDNCNKEITTQTTLIEYSCSLADIYTVSIYSKDSIETDEFIAVTQGFVGMNQIVDYKVDYNEFVDVDKFDFEFELNSGVDEDGGIFYVTYTPINLLDPSDNGVFHIYVQANARIYYKA